MVQSRVEVLLSIANTDDTGWKRRDAASLHRLWHTLLTNKRRLRVIVLSALLPDVRSWTRHTLVHSAHGLTMRRENDSDILSLLGGIRCETGFDVARNSFHELWMGRPAINDAPIDAGTRAL